MNSFNFQIVSVANLAAIVTPFPDHICYFTEDTENYYIWENDALKEIFVDASSITWNNITNKPTTITGFGITDAVKANNGTVDYVAKFTPDGNTIGDSLIQDDGTSVSIGVLPSSLSELKISSSKKNALELSRTASGNQNDEFALWAKSTITPSTINQAILAEASGASTNTAILSKASGDALGSNTAIKAFASQSRSANIAISGTAYPDGLNLSTNCRGVAGFAEGSTTLNNGVYAQATGTTFQNIGVIAKAGGLASDSNIGFYAEVQGGLSKNIGLSVSAIGNQGQNYSLQLIDNTQLPGRYLKCITNQGLANWANINITEVTNGLSSTLLGAPNGIATLDSNSKLVMSQMPISVMDYKGTYDIVTNTPMLIDGAGNTGDVYACTTAGTRTFGAGNTLTVSVGDWLIYNGTKWEKTLGNNIGSGTVSSVGLSLGTTGTDVNISNSPITSSGNINLNIPTASATARGLLSISDWNLFNGKVSAVSGTNNYVAKFTPNGTTISNSQIQDNGTSLGIGTSPLSAVKLAVLGATNQYGIRAYGGSQGYAGVYAVNYSSGTGESIGLTAEAQNSTGSNIAIQGTASTAGATNIGASLLATGGTLNYAVQLKDGSQTTTGGKFLKDKGEGKANWTYLPDSAQIMCSDMTSVITVDTGSLPKAIWVAPCDGQLTDAFASLRVPQAGGTAFTVLVKTSSITIATLTFSNGNLQFTSTNPAVTQVFSKGNIFEFYVSQVGDGSARSLLVTLNYIRT